MRDHGRSVGQTNAEQSAHERASRHSRPVVLLCAVKDGCTLSRGAVHVKAPRERVFSIGRMRVRRASASANTARGAYARASPLGSRRVERSRRSRPGSLRQERPWGNEGRRRAPSPSSLAPKGPRPTERAPSTGRGSASSRAARLRRRGSLRCSTCLRWPRGGSGRRMALQTRASAFFSSGSQALAVDHEVGYSVCS